MILSLVKDVGWGVLMVAVIIAAAFVMFWKTTWEIVDTAVTGRYHYEVDEQLLGWRYELVEPTEIIASWMLYICGGIEWFVLLALTLRGLGWLD